MTNSIVKGKSFERMAAKLFTEKTKVKFQRTPSSGAMATAQHITDARFKGDLFCENQNFNDWVVECKVIKDKITLADLLNSKSNLWQWWRQLVNEAKSDTPKKLALVFKYSGSKVFVMTDSIVIEESLGLTSVTRVSHLRLGILS